MVFFYFFLFFLFIFGPVFNTVGSWADIIFVLSAILFFVHSIVRKRLLPNYVTVFSVLLPLSIFTCIVASFYAKITMGDLMQIILKPIRILITLVAGYSLIYTIYHKYPEKYLHIILKFIFLSIVLHAAIMIVQFHNPVFREFVYRYTFGGEIRSTFDYEFRMGGLSGSTGGAVLSVVQSIGIVMLPFLLKEMSSKYVRYFFILCGFSIFYSILICGRSGIWSMLIFTFISIFFVDSGNKFSKSLKLFKLIMILFFGMFFLITFLESMEDSNPVFLALNRTLDTFLSFKESGNFDDNTVNVLEEHILLPTDFKTLFLGDTEVIVNTQFDRKLNSDIGYIRNIWGFGIFGTIIYILPMLKYFRLSLKYFYFSNFSKLLLIISIITFSFHAKENFIYTRMLFSIYSLVLALFYFEVYIKNKNNLL